ncbi:hypothetical protein C8Q74DRAFT_466645 [Fomes fomentarius]|nr:hypothetical protein C8Q74DRAFT_466645 [Fomes fomentarius]
MLPLLQRTQSIAYAAARRYASHATNTHVLPTLSLVDPVLPTPEPLTPRLISLGIDTIAAQRISSVLVNTALELKRQFETDFDQRRETLKQRAAYYQDPKHASAISSAYSLFYSKTVREWAAYIVDNFVPRLVQARIHRESSSSRDRKRPFNQNAVPILERIFAENAFPTRLEKYDLAAQWGMDYRQIHVWFQNRRSRVRKEGTMLKRRESHGSLVRELEDAVVGSLLHTRCDESETDSDYNCTSLPTSEGYQTFFNLDAPHHAFPSPYPPQCEYNPFPISQDIRKFQLPWIRVANGTSKPTSSVSMSELTSAFTGLSIADDVSSTVPVHRRSPYLPLGFATICLRAPHPALITRTRRASRTIRSGECCSSSPSRSNSSFQSRSVLLSGETHILQHVGLRRISASPYTAHAESVSTSKRTVPKRLPRHPPASHFSSGGHGSLRLESRSAFKTVSDKSQSSYGYSSPSRRSSSRSDSESPLSTPPSLPTILPNLKPEDKHWCPLITRSDIIVIVTAFPCYLLGHALFPLPSTVVTSIVVLHQHFVLSLLISCNVQVVRVFIAAFTKFSKFSNRGGFSPLHCK